MRPDDAPLSGVRVLELGHYIAAPFCTQLLADQGADVIKVESADAAFNRGGSGYFDMLNRNKRSIVLDLKRPSDVDRFDALVRTADVVVTNFAVGVPERLSVGHERLRGVNPRLVYTQLSGYGVDSPHARKPAFDGTIQAMSGLLHLTGAADGPPMLPGVFIPDHLTGLYAALGTMFALRRRETTGVGEYIDLAMLDSVLTLQLTAFSDVLDKGLSPTRSGGRVRVSYASVYAAVDGYVFLAPLTAAMWGSLATAIGAPGLVSYYPNERGATDSRLAARDELDEVIEAWTRRRTVDEITTAMGVAGVPCNRVYSIEDVVADEGVRHRGMVRAVPTSDGRIVHVAGSPLPAMEDSFQVPPPRAGQHTEEILEELRQDAKG